MSDPKLSVITACYQHGKYLRQSAESVLVQTEANIELIIVNDGSPDNTAEVMQEIAASDARVLTITNATNRGLAFSQNAGIEAASAPWVLKNDADDYIAPTYVEKILAAAAADPLRNIIYSPARLFGLVDRVYRYKDFDAATMIDVFQIPGPSAFRKAMWEAVGGYDETMRSGEDWDLYVRAQQVVGLVPHQLSEPLWFYRQHGGVRASDHGIARLPHLRAYWREHRKENIGSRTWGQWCAERGIAA